MSTNTLRYNNIAVFLHWLIAALIIFQLGLGWHMVDEPKGMGAYTLFQLHKSIGVSILLLSVLRLLWRITHQAPALPATMPKWEQIAASLAHLAFYGIMLGLPLTGWLLVSASSTNIPTVLFGTIPFPHLPFIASLATDTKAQLHELGELSHYVLALATTALLVLHIGAVLKHQLWVKDTVFSHMAVGAKTGWSEWRLWLVLVLVPAVFVLAWLYPTPQAKKAQPVIMQITAPVLEYSRSTQPTATQNTDTQTTIIEPVVWYVNYSQSQLGFSTAWSGDAVNGVFNQWHADIVFAAHALDKSSIKVTVNLSNVNTGDAQRDDALLGADWFDAVQYPQAVFSSSRIISKGKNRYQAQGTLSLRGKQQPVVLDFNLNINANKATAQGTVNLDRTVFGVGQGEWAATDSIPAVVKVAFKLQATAK